MGIESFNSLTSAEQDEIVRNKGFFIINDNESNIFFDVYKVDDFYVQFSYELNSDESPIVTTFSNPEDLFFYAEKGLPV